MYRNKTKLVARDTNIFDFLSFRRKSKTKIIQFFRVRRKYDSKKLQYFSCCLMPNRFR